MAGRLKKVYDKPQVKQVKLVAEEAVLFGCKSPSGPNKDSSRCASAGNCQKREPGS